MTTANVNVRQILLKKGNTARSLTYTGAIGEITLDTDLNSIRVHNGITAGGVNILATQAQIDTLSNTISTITGLDSNLVANISSLLSNAASQQTQIANITDGTATFGNLIPSANVTYNLGSPTRQWANLYISSDTIYLAGVPLRVDVGGNLTINGNSIGGGTGSGHSLVNGSAVVNLASDGKLSLPGYGDAFITTVSNTSVTLGMSTGRVNIYSGGNYFGFAANDFLLPVNGQIVFPDQTAQTTAFTGTGDIGFVDNAIYSGSGVIVENADLSNAATAAVILPANGSSDTLQINNDGQVTISAGGKYWNFNTDGTLVLPNGSALDFGSSHKFSTKQSLTTSIDLRDHTNRGLYTDVNGVKVQSNNYSWSFGIDGKLTVPGSILTPNGVIRESTIDGGPSIDSLQGVTISSNGLANKWYFGTDGTFNLPESVSAGYAIVQSTSGIQVNANGSLWAFGTDGKLAVPQNIGVDINWTSDTAGGGPGDQHYDSLRINNDHLHGLYITNTMDGTPKSWLFSKDGQLQSPQSGRIGDTYSDGNGIGLSAGPGEDDYAVINSHSGAQYVETNETAVYIGTNWPTTNTTWAFGKDGNVTLPNGYKIGGGDAGRGIELTTDRGTILFGNHPEPGAPNHFHIMKDNASGVDLYFGDDFNYVKLPGVDSPNYGVEIGSSDIGNNGPEYKWRFETSGKLTFPDGTVQTTAYVNNNVNMDGGGASTVYEVETAYADGGFASIRSFSETFDGNEGNNYILDGGRA